MRILGRHAIALDAERFWRVIHAPDYERRVADALGLAAYREVERRDEPEAVYRRIEAIPRRLPPAVVATLGRLVALDSAHYVEEQWRRRDRMEVRWRATPSVWSDRVKVEGTVRVEPVDAHGCLRILEGDVRVRAPWIGATLERAVARAIGEASDRSAGLVEPGV